ncbi:MAG: hypothetical protein QM802_18640 [Agriterribacter sp.]
MKKALLSLHVAIFLAGFTGILGGSLRLMKVYWYGGAYSLP